MVRSDMAFPLIPFLLFGVAAAAASGTRRTRSTRESEGGLDLSLGSATLGGGAGGSRLGVGSFQSDREPAVPGRVPPGTPAPQPGVVGPGQAGYYCQFIGTTRFNTGECDYATPSPGTFVDLNFASSLTQADDTESWGWVGASRLTPGQRRLLLALDMAYGTQFTRVKPRNWSNDEWQILSTVMGHPNNPMTWLNETDMPEWKNRRLKNVTVDYEWKSMPKDFGELQSRSGTNLPVVYFP